MDEWAIRVGVAAIAVSAVSVTVSSQPMTLPAAPSGVQTFTRDGIQFSRIQAPNVQAVVPQEGHIQQPVGGGSWDFGIARTELTQGQWVEFLNAFNTVAIPQNQPYADGLQTILAGTYGAGPGMGISEFGPQGRGIWQVTPEGSVRPVRQIGWFGAAVYCNWLSSGRQTTINALVTGSYDLRQWDLLVPATWPTITRAADAEYFIPNYNEWAVASFYDPNRYGTDQGGWWSHLNGRDALGTPGAPGVGDTSFHWDPVADGFPSMYDQLLPVVAYPGSQSPWGLFDTSGSMFEVLDDVSEYGRMFAGTPAGPSLFPELDVRLERIGWIGSSSPLDAHIMGFRIATTVPSPAAGVVFMLFLSVRVGRRRNHHPRLS